MPVIDTLKSLLRLRPYPTDVLPSIRAEFAALEEYYKKANEPLAALLRRNMGNEQSGQDWARTIYGDNYATNVHVYRAVKLRADAVAAARLKAWTLDSKGNLEWVGENHVVQQLLDRVNPNWSRVDMWRAVETYLSLWGSCFRWVAKPTTDPSTWEMWVLRPDKVAVIVDKRPGTANQYIRGYIFDPHGANFPMNPDEVIWDRYFNPLDEFSGLSPIAPARLIIEMQNSMLSTNRDLFRNGLLTSNLAFLMRGPLQPEQLELFYERMAERHAGKGNAHRPIVTDMGQGDVKNLGFSNREMEFLEGLNLSKEYIQNTYGIPEELMPGARHPTFSNRAEARKEFNESTIEQEWTLLESAMQERFVPTFPPTFRSLILRFDRSEIPALQENEDKKSERMLKEVTAGVLTVEEYREATGKDPAPIGVLYVPISVRPVVVGSSNISLPEPAETPSEESMSFSNGTSTVLPALSAAPEVTDLDRTTWDAFIRRFTRAENDFHELMDELFEEQRDESLRLLNRLVGANRDPKGQNTLVKKHVRGLPKPIFNPEDWRQRFRETGLPLITEILGRSARAQVTEFGLGISFDINNASTQTWLDERVKFWSSHVNEETGRLITEEIRVGISEGEGIKKLQGRVNKVFDFNTEFRSELIARTEATASSNQGHLEAYRQADVPRKRWLATLDGRTRDTHRSAHGQTVDREQSFLVGGAEMFMPGQGPAKEVVFCRCTSLPVFEVDSE